MADEHVEQVESPEQPDAATSDAPKKRSPMLAIIKAVAFVSVLVVVEVVAASMLIPTAQETERLGRQFVAASAGESAHDDGSDGSEAGPHAVEHNVREVELGKYNVTRFNPATNSTLSIDFELFGTVLADSEEEFNELFEKSKVRLREAVIMTLYGAEPTDLTDAGLGLIKRRILKKTNLTLGEPLVREVLFSKFNFVER